MTIIGLVGNKGVGKDTVADYLVKHNFHKIAFADVLKKAIKVLFNWSNEELNGSNKEVIDETWNVAPREILQLIGTECLRDIISPKIDTSITFNGVTKEFSFHIKRLYLNMKKLLETTDNIVISDIRFQDELDFVHFIGGIVIKVDRNVETNQYNQHKSENNINKLKDIDSIINNNSSLVDLHENIDLVLI